MRDQEDPKEQWARAEGELVSFKELGIESCKENVELVIAQLATPQLPQGEGGKYMPIIDQLGPNGNPEKLKTAMQEKGIISIVHAEGPTVWHHTKLALENIQAGTGTPEEKKELALILLFHDLGKTEVAGNEGNHAATTKKLANGVLQQSMIGHAEARMVDIPRRACCQWGYWQGTRACHDRNFAPYGYLAVRAGP